MIYKFKLLHVLAFAFECNWFHWQFSVGFDITDMQIIGFVNAGPVGFSAGLDFNNGEDDSPEDEG